MNKAILMSIQPKWLKRILDGEKTIEIRKTMPKCELPIDVYLYCTDSGKVMDNRLREVTYINGRKVDEPRQFYLASRKSDRDLNGKVVAKFTLKEVVPIPCKKTYLDGELVNVRHIISAFDAVKIGTDSNPDEFLLDYSNWKTGLGHLYAWHITDLVVFDKPQPLGVFHKICANDGSGCPDNNCPYYETPSYEYGEVNYDCYDLRPIKRPPQSWQYFDEIQSHCPKCFKTMVYRDNKWYCESILDCENKKGIEG